MTISYTYEYKEDSFVYFVDTGVIKSIQGYLRGTNSKNGLSHAIAILAVKPNAGKTPLTLENATKEDADKWMTAFLALTPGLKLSYENTIANNIKDQVTAAAKAPPAKESAGNPLSNS